MEQGYLTRDKRELSELLHLFLDIGEAIHKAGGEIFRVEDTLSRLGAAYGAERTDVFAITSNLEVTMAFPGDIEITRTRRIRGGGTDLRRLEALNDLSRRVCASPIPPDELRAAIRATEEVGLRLPVYIGSALAGGAFAVFFGGGIWDGIIAAFFGLLICYLQECLPRFLPNSAVVYFTAALLTGIGVCLLGRIFSALLPDKIMIGDIMLLIPGIALTTAIRNILIGDTISGVLRFVESLVFAGALAGGFMIAMGLLDVEGVGLGKELTPLLQDLVQLLTGAIGSVGFALIFRLRGRYLPLAAIGGLLNWGGYLLLFHLTGHLFFSCLVSSMAAALYAELLARRLRAPATLFLVPAVIPSIPGSNLYYTMQAAVRGNYALVGENAIGTLKWAFGIAGGISIIVVFFAVWRAIKQQKK